MAAGRVLIENREGGSSEEEAGGGNTGAAQKSHFWGIKMSQNGLFGHFS